MNPTKKEAQSILRLLIADREDLISCDLAPRIEDEDIKKLQSLINNIPDGEVKLSALLEILQQEIHFASLTREDMSIGYYQHTEYDGSYWISIVEFENDLTIKEIDCELCLSIKIRAYLYDLFRNETKIIDDLETSKYKLSQDEIMTLEKWNDDADYVWSENTNQWNDENDFRLFLNDYFMKDIQIKFNIFDYETIIIDSEAKLVIPLLETLKEDK